MISTGIATVFVSSMDKAVEFYTETLGLKLDHRYEDHWAQISAGGFLIGLHPAGATAAGTAGAIQIGFSVDAPIEDSVKALESRGVVFKGPVVSDGPVKIAYFGDQDGNELYLVSS